MELKDTLKRGDVLVRQYGYSMTLYEFYQVYAIKGNKVELYPLQVKSSGWIGFMECEVEPIMPKGYLMKNLISKRFNKWGGIAIDKNSLYLYDKNRKYIENHAD